jgi:hypothetical protein
MGRASSVEGNQPAVRREAQMDIGPVELIVLTFPGQRADPAVVTAIADVVSQGHVTILDLVVLSRDPEGVITLIDFDENLDPVGLGALDAHGQALVSDADMDLVRDSLVPDSTAAVIVYEETWARRVAGAVRDAGGEVALHVQLPPQIVETAIAAAVAG